MDKRVASLLILVVTSSGCGAKGPTMIPVSGTVTMGGKPIEKVRVEFHPVDVGNYSTGLTDAQGHFTLRTLHDDREGAVIGRHKVVMFDTTLIQRLVGIRESENIDLTEGRKSRIATKYGDKMATPVEVGVSDGEHEFTFEVDPLSAQSTVDLPPTGQNSLTIPVDPTDPRSVKAAEESVKMLKEADPTVEVKTVPSAGN